MAMEPIPSGRPTTRDSKGGKGSKFGGKRSRDGDRNGNGKYTPKLLGKAYFQRKKGCPFSGPKAPKIDYKDVRLLTKYISDYGKILPRHLTGVCAAKQRELAQAIKRARVLSLLPYNGRLESDAPRAPRGDRPGFDRGPREGRTFDRTPREDRAPRAETAPVTE